MIRTSYETIKYIDLTKTVRDVVHHVTSLGRYVSQRVPTMFHRPFVFPIPNADGKQDITMSFLSSCENH